MTKELLKIAISVTRKINLGNYESVDIYVALSDVTTETTPEEIEEALDAGEVVYGAITRRIVQKTAEIQERA